LLVNKRNRMMRIALPVEFGGGKDSVVERGSPSLQTMRVPADSTLELGAFAVAVVDARGASGQ